MQNLFYFQGWLKGRNLTRGVQGLFPGSIYVQFIRKDFNDSGYEGTPHSKSLNNLLMKMLDMRLKYEWQYIYWQIIKKSDVVYCCCFHSLIKLKAFSDITIKIVLTGSL